MNHKVSCLDIISYAWKYPVTSARCVSGWIFPSQFCNCPTWRTCTWRCWMVTINSSSPMLTSMELTQISRQTCSDKRQLHDNRHNCLDQQTAHPHHQTERDSQITHTRRRHRCLTCSPYVWTYRTGTTSQYEPAPVPLHNTHHRAPRCTEELPARRKCSGRKWR